MDFKTVKFTLNKVDMTCDVPTNSTLLDFLRNGLNLTGTKCSCEEGECGACTVIYDGNATTSCLIMAPDIDGHSIETVEGLCVKGELHPLQKAFIAKGAIQCGFCTPGMLMSAKALLDKIPHPTKEQIKEAMYGNLCRCTGYQKIIDAVLSVANGEVLCCDDDSVWKAVEDAQGHGCNS